MAPAAPLFRFASFSITNQIFYQSSLSLALVNLKPLVPGRFRFADVLVIPKRVVPRFGELTADETTDLFLSVQQVARVIEKEYKAQSMNIAVQDGALAGQSVPHVHVHLIPRRKDDFEPMDEVYTALDSANMAADYLARQSRTDRKKVFGVDDEDRKPRSKEVMKEEARRLSLLFPEGNRGVFTEGGGEE
ncbi:BZ3500_MvSof-1268-A1-R1_Chr5-2g07901 [Microbotryum saponariae]|uniref:Bis(5'-adenosyl)-triphosphatase n=1 Tax=Microbotryum saponariae TaxID=289078 RepID=A0A2X0LKK5_9BASI|nr:BZ3500_MvSof-1268-A1-R1_Chr5-2g07901 [Microbotryum saponariae]SDA05770.1 BZ3501_MvSof-1269-A2-R1_Chr5-2g07723 [Microbotryum saponariae]